MTEITQEIALRRNYQENSRSNKSIHENIIKARLKGICYKKVAQNSRMDHEIINISKPTALSIQKKKIISM